MPGSQISSRPLKDINHLMNTEIKAKIIKIDSARGNLCTSRKAIQADAVASDKKKFFQNTKLEIF